MYLDQTIQDDIEVDEHGTNLIFRFRRHDHILTAIVAEVCSSLVDSRFRRC